MSIQDRIAEDATKVASLTSIHRVRKQDEHRATNAVNGGQKRLADRLRMMRSRLEKKL